MQDMATETDRKPYDFATIGEQIAAALIEAAENQVTAANNVLANATVVADGIRAQIKNQSDLLDNANSRLMLFSDSVTQAYNKFNGE
jgi:hypothetical protein